MKNPYYFSTWVDVSKNISISCDEKSIYVQPINMFVGKGDAIISLWHDDLVSCETRYEDDAISNGCIIHNKVHYTYTINGFKHEEDSLTRITSNDLRYAKRFTESTPSDLILAKSCELTGAKMYGDYIVLPSFTYENKIYHAGDLVGEGMRYDKNDFDISEEEYPFGAYKYGVKIFSFCAELSSFTNIYEGGETGAWDFKCNIFEEYSKFLRGEDNKWEKVKKLVL